MNQNTYDLINEQLAPLARTSLTNAYQNMQGKIPEMMHGVMLMKAATNFSEEMKVSSFPMIFTLLRFKFGQSFSLDHSEYKSAVEKITQTVLAEFVKLPSS